MEGTTKRTIYCSFKEYSLIEVVIKIDVTSRQRLETNESKARYTYFS